MRLFSQLAQDCQYKVGKILWIASHSGPETAEDSRTHFGIFAPGVTQLFPKGQILNLHPWEYNEVPVVLGAALKSDIPIIVLHLTRPPIEIPDRDRLGIPSHYYAAKGAYLIRNLRSDQPRGGTVFVQGTSVVNNIIKILPSLDHEELNVKIICTISPELFSSQPAKYRDQLITPADRIDSTFFTTQAKRLMYDWNFNSLADEYALSADWDDRWRTGGSLEDVLEEAHLSADWLLKGIKRFVQERSTRLTRMQNDIDAACPKT